MPIVDGMALISGRTVALPRQGKYYLHNAPPLANADDIGPALIPFPPADAGR